MKRTLGYIEPLIDLESFVGNLSFFFLSFKGANGVDFPFL